jgi:hypothetical protein
VQKIYEPGYDGTRKAYLPMIGITLPSSWYEKNVSRHLFDSLGIRN